MKQSTIIFLILFSVLITSLTACVEDQSKHGRKLIHKDSLRASSNTRATLTISDFDKGGDSGGPAECDNMYHSNEMFIVSLPARWYKDGKKCFKFVNINYNGINVQPMIVDECDCADDILVASKAVWRFLRVPESDWGELEVTWSYA